MRFWQLNLVVVGTTMLNASCQETSPPPRDAERGAVATSLSLTLPSHGVSGVRFLVLAPGDDCGGTPLAAQSVALAGARVDDEVHTFADTLFVLAEGAYRVCAVPMSGDEPSSECAAGLGDIDVRPGVTQEVTLVSQCTGPESAGLGTVVELNDPPRIASVSLAPGRFISVCEDLSIEVSADDPNQDDVQVRFTVSDGPDGWHLRQDDGHAAFSGPAGDYGIRIDAEDSHRATSSLTVPVHITDQACAVPDDVQAIFEARCSPCHITGSSAGLHLSPALGSYAALVGRPSTAAACAKRTLVVPGDAAKSYVVAKLRAAPDLCGSPMPRGRPMLPEAEIAAVEAWINALPH